MIVDFVAMMRRTWRPRGSFGTSLPASSLSLMTTRCHVRIAEPQFAHALAGGVHPVDRVPAVVVGVGEELHLDGVLLGQRTPRDFRRDDPLVGAEDPVAALGLRDLEDAVVEIPARGELAQFLAGQVVIEDDLVARHEVVLGVECHVFGHGRAAGRRCGRLVAAGLGRRRLCGIRRRRRFAVLADAIDGAINGLVDRLVRLLVDLPFDLALDLVLQLAELRGGGRRGTQREDEQQGKDGQRQACAHDGLRMA
ncbi:MAG: hypothetical protein IPI48_11975 [bacterium]|nr:hypothetical protein [bacterium]